jgi:YHS domain-containing protein
MKESICSVCGKKHFRNPGNMYKLKFCGRTYIFCGYKCYNKAKDIADEKDAESFYNLINSKESNDEDTYK